MHRRRIGGLVPWRWSCLAYVPLLAEVLPYVNVSLAPWGTEQQPGGGAGPGAGRRSSGEAAADRGAGRRSSGEAAAERGAGLRTSNERAPHQRAGTPPQPSGLKGGDRRQHDVDGDQGRALERGRLAVA